MLDLKKKNFKIERKELDGEELFIRHLTMSEIEKISTMKDAVKVPKTLIKMCLCDADGNLLNYLDEDIDNQPASLIKSIAELIMQVQDLSEKKS